MTHDADGNLTYDGTRTYTYDSRDRLVAVGGATGATYTYDDLGRRTSRTSAGVTTTTVHDGTEPTLETVGTEVVPLFGGPGAGEVYGRLAPSGQQWLLADELGSTVAITNASGVVRGSYTYEPFGASTSTGTVGSNSIRFTNRETDATGLSYHGARHLAPEPGPLAERGPDRLRGREQQPRVVRLRRPGRLGRPRRPGPAGLTARRVRLLVLGARQGLQEDRHRLRVEEVPGRLAAGDEGRVEAGPAQGVRGPGASSTARTRRTTATRSATRCATCGTRRTEPSRATTRSPARSGVRSAGRS